MGSKKPFDGQLIESPIGAHDASVPHQFNHTQGICPKCASKQRLVAYCEPRTRFQNRLATCEVDGGHLHVQCHACGYAMVERCHDQLLAAQEEGWLIAESPLMAALAAVAHRTDGIRLPQELVGSFRGWTVRFTRDFEQGSITITAEETPKEGEPAQVELRPEFQEPTGRRGA